MFLSACFAAFMLTSSSAQTGLEFDGVDDFVQTSFSGISGSGSRTVEAWIKTTVTSIGNQQVIVDWGTFGTSTRFTMNLLQNNSLRVEVSGGSVQGTTAINDGEWHHVAVTYDASASPNTTLYIDGEVENSGSMTVNTGSSEDVMIGRRTNDGFNNFKSFTGSIDEVRIWDFARSQTEIEADKDAELCGDESGLVMYYQFNEGENGMDNTGIDTTTDLSTNNNAGVLTNFALDGTPSNWSDGATLTATGIDAGVTLNEGVLAVAEAGATYQWFDCDNGNQAIDGATGQTYTPTVPGIYSVEVTSDGGCSIVSSCMAVEEESLGIHDSTIDLVNIYPNPTSGSLKVALNGVYNNVEARLVSLTGQEVGRYQHQHTNGFALDLSAFQSGWYLLNLKADGLKATTIKVIKM